MWRVERSGIVGWVGDWEGGTVLGGLFCLWRVLLSCIFPGRGFVADVIARQRPNRPPD